MAFGAKLPLLLLNDLLQKASRYSLALGSTLSEFIAVCHCDGIHTFFVILDVFSLLLIHATLRSSCFG